MVTTVVIEQQPINPAADDHLETLLTEHRYWRARLRNAIEDSKRLRANAAAVRQHRRDISSPLRITVS
jgi:hypothetical protein